VAAASATKKTTGLNKIRSMLSSSSGSHNGRHRDTMADFDEAGNGTGSYCSSHSSSSQSQSQQDVRVEVRHYDEQTKPKRLLKQTSQRRETNEAQQEGVGQQQQGKLILVQQLKQLVISSLKK
jgi:hypothetical protein